MLAGKVGVSTSEGLGRVANAIVRAMTQAGPESTSSLLRTVPLEEQRDKEWSELRMQMIAAQSTQELREVEYKVDEFLTRYPNNPDARLLKKKIADSTEPRHYAPRHYAPSAPRMAPLLRGCLIPIALLLGIAAIVWIFAR